MHFVKHLSTLMNINNTISKGGKKVPRGAAAPPPPPPLNETLQVEAVNRPVPSPRRIGQCWDRGSASVDDAVRRIARLGPGTQMAKLDIESAHWMIPVHPQDQPLLGVRWKGEVYVDAAIPFSLRSAQNI